MHLFSSSSCIQCLHFFNSVNSLQIQRHKTIIPCHPPNDLTVLLASKCAFKLPRRSVASLSGRSVFGASKPQMTQLLTVQKFGYKTVQINVSNNSNSLFWKCNEIHYMPQKHDMWIIESYTSKNNQNTSHKGYSSFFLLDARCVYKPLKCRVADAWTGRVGSTDALAAFSFPTCFQ